MNYSFQDCGDKLHFISHEYDSSSFLNYKDLCDNSTYDIAGEFYDDLECFITDHVDNNGNLAPDVVEFELLTHHLLDYCEQYKVIYDEYQRKSNIFMNGESTVHNSDHRS